VRRLREATEEFAAELGAPAISHAS
jgi:hypothetical protein